MLKINKGLSLCIIGLFPSILKAQNKPNLVIIIADQFRADAIQFIGKEPVITPNLDNLAKNGVIFTNAVSSYPVSSPARAMLMTGMYPPQNKVIGNCNSKTAPYHVELPANAICWSDILKSLDYSTGYIGKWHLDSPHKPYIDTYNNKGQVAWNEWCPKSRRHGFDYWVAYGTYDRHLHPMYWNTNSARNEFYYVNKWGPEYEAEKAINFISRNHNKPFALMVSMNPPHTGYELVPQRFKSIYKNLNTDSLCSKLKFLPPKGTEDGNYYRKNIANYYAAITGVDFYIGKIINKLRQDNLLDNTLIVFTSDHGVCMGAHNEKGKNIYYDEAMRIPMIISWKGHIKPKVDRQTMIAIGDLYPTLLNTMGLGNHIPANVQTNDLSKYLLSEKCDTTLIQPYYLIYPDSTNAGYRGLRTHRYTFAVHSDGNKINKIILFDRKKDPFELNNIAKEKPIIVQNLLKKLKKFLKEKKDPLQLKNE